MEPAGYHIDFILCDCRKLSHDFNILCFIMLNNQRLEMYCILIHFFNVINCVQYVITASV